MSKLQGHVDDDRAALAHDQLVRPRAANNPRGYPRWDGSEAERLLKIDVDGGEHQKMEPRKLRQKRPRGPQSQGKTLLVGQEEEVSFRNDEDRFLSLRCWVGCCVLE